MGIVNERMKLLRSQSDVTLKDMAKLIGVSEATVQRYESGAIEKVPYKAIIEYSKKFNATPAYIMGWDESAKNPFDIANNTTLFEQAVNFKNELSDNKEIYELGIEEDIILECYRSLDPKEKELVKRMLKYKEKYDEYMGREKGNNNIYEKK